MCDNMGLQIVNSLFTKQPSYCAYVCVQSVLTEFTLPSHPIQKWNKTIFL